MQRELEMLERFHQVYDCAMADAPCHVNEETRQLRFNLIAEELTEYNEAAKDRNHPGVDVADALADLLYVVYGTIIAHGLQHLMPAIFAEVHRSNLSKLGEDGKPIYRESDRKVLKGPNFTPPDIASILSGQPPSHTRDKVGHRIDSEGL